VKKQREAGVSESVPGLIAYWRQVGQCSPHLRSQRPCMTDSYCRRAVWRLLSRYLAPVQDRTPLKVFKLDLYNEATWTQYSCYFFERGMVVYAIDICDEIITLARRRTAQTGYRDWLMPSQADFRRIPFADNSFDVSFSYGSIEHVREWRLALEEQVRVTRRGGLILVGVPNLLNIWLKPFIQSTLELLGIMGIYMNHEIHFPWWRIRNAVAELDVTDIHVHGVQILPKPARFLDLATENYLAHHQEYCLIRGLTALKRAVLSPLLTVSEWIEQQDHWVNLLAGDTIVVKATKR
jgi:SAM-dependent methyltransferase